MPEVRIYLFGYPRVESEGVPLAIPRRKALALLAYLAVTQSHHSRDVLAALLWPEEESAKAYAFLRNALWVLHQTPIEPWVLATRHMVGLRADDSLWIDVAQFRHLLQACQRHAHPEEVLCADGVDALRTAVDLARERFLAGFTADDSRAFEEWQYSEADILSQELALAFEKLSDHYEVAGNVDAALTYAQRRLAVESLDESTHRRVMRLYAKRGDRAAALRVFENCVQALDLELSITPSEETRALADEIRSRPFTPPAPRTAPRRSLPAYRLPLVGREDDVLKVLSLLGRDDCRLATLTGTGGSGKTRLAVEVAEQASGFEDGAVFVSLADIESPALVPAAILEALHETVGPGDPRGSRETREPGDDVARRLSGRDLLVILDNTEHLAHDVRWLADLVNGTDRPHFLLTSRQEMGVRGEWIYPVEGLQCPGSEHEETPAEFPAVQLFLQAARRADVRFTPSPADLEAVASIARLLQGNPLGLELAASWARAMPCAEIAAEILRSVDFLKTEQQLVPRRHRSLRAAFQGSWDLLDRAGRNAFRALSVFRAGFTPDSASNVCGATLPALASLVSKSLLERTPTGRYEMLEVVREYANERLRATPEESAEIQDRHAGYFLALLESQESRLKRSEQRDALDLLAADEANIYAAWRRAASQGATSELARGAMGLFLFCDMTTRFVQAASLFRLAADAVQRTSTKTGRTQRATFRGIEGWFTTFADPAAAAQRFEESFSDAASLPLNHDLAFVRILAAFAGHHRAPRTPRADDEDALRFFEEHDFVWETAAACEALSAYQAAPAAALALVDRSVALRESLGDTWGVALGRLSRGLVLERMGKLDEALAEARASADLREGAGLDPQGLWGCFITMGVLEGKLGRPVQSARHFDKAIEIAVHIHNPFEEGVAHEQLARLGLSRGHSRSAREHAERAAACYDAAHRADDAVRVRQLASEASQRRKTG